MEKFYNVTQFSKLINVKVKTLQKWDRDGILTSYRTPTNRRYYTHNQYLNYIGKANISEKRENVIYTRVSNRTQKDDLTNQLNFIYNYTSSSGINISNVYSDVASGLNYKRKQWNDLLFDCMDNKIDTIYISHKDRFVRFGYDWFINFLDKKCNVKVIVIDNVITSPEQEMIQDLISIIHVFSCRIYGLRKYKSKISKHYDVSEDGDEDA